jgi:uncharacterized membrane protein
VRTALRLGQLLAMVLWIGGLVFFAFVLAPTAFRVLPTKELAGSIVGATLRELHLLGLACGALFLAVTAVMFSAAPKRIKGRYEMEMLLAVVMMTATAYLQWNVLAAMEVDRAKAGGDISAAARSDPSYIHFEKLHVRSTRVEGLVLLCGLAVVCLMSREAVKVD